MVRMYWQTALNKLEQLGFETVQKVLTGKYPTLEVAQESGQARQEMEH
jgi:phosphoribosylformylglycinamidine (FGAM) synthase PurS component